MGDFYLTCLTFRHPLITGDPILPFAYIITERKFRRDYEVFVRELLECYDGLKKASVYFCSDKEFSIGDRVWEEVQTVNCWFHVQRDVKREVKKMREVKDPDALIAWFRDIARF